MGVKKPPLWVVGFVGKNNTNLPQTGDIYFLIAQSECVIKSKGEIMIVGTEYAERERERENSVIYA
jgi:hypothetical protein